MSHLTVSTNVTCEKSEYILATVSYMTRMLGLWDRAANIHVVVETGEVLKDTDNWMGCCDEVDEDGEVLIRVAGLDGDEFAVTLAHELVHARQTLRGQPFDEGDTYALEAGLAVAWFHEYKTNWVDV